MPNIRQLPLLIVALGAVLIGANFPLSSTHSPLPNLNSAVVGDSAPASINLEKENISLIFVGDIMLDRYVAKYAKEFGDASLFSGVKEIFNNKDLVVGNLEGTITNNESISSTDTSVLRFTFAPKYARFLKDTGFTTLSLANNHSFDFGQSGYDQTRDFLNTNGLTFFGSPYNDQNISTSITVKNKEICFIGYHDLYTYDASSTTEEIRTIRPNCSYILVFAHWGEEYSGQPIRRQKELAHKFIDAGADLVIGSHPHVVEPLEIYKNKAIFYSLGNFIFDQYFSFQTTHGLAVAIDLRENRVIFKFIPISISKNGAVLANWADGKRVIGSLVEDSELKSETISEIISTRGLLINN